MARAGTAVPRRVCVQCCSCACGWVSLSCPRGARVCRSPGAVSRPSWLCRRPQVSGCAAPLRAALRLRRARSSGAAAHPPSLQRGVPKNVVSPSPLVVRRRRAGRRLLCVGGSRVWLRAPRLCAVVTGVCCCARHTGARAAYGAVSWRARNCSSPPCWRVAVCRRRGRRCRYLATAPRMVAAIVGCRQGVAARRRHVLVLSYPPFLICVMAPPPSVAINTCLPPVVTSTPLAG
jgi:hypothetical protein